MAKETIIVAFLGLAGWYEQGRCVGGTFSRSGIQESSAPIRVDLRPILDGDMAENVSKIWKRPSLDLSLPDNNVRNLFEGCIGEAGTTAGHLWDGDLGSLQSLDSVGLNVYLSILKAQGAIIEGWSL
jgi:hypothetical protein